jgi:DNA-binding protein H-NS
MTFLLNFSRFLRIGCSIAGYWDKHASPNHQKVMNMATGPRTPANLKSMSVDRLTMLRTQVDAILSAKVAEERRATQDKLTMLDRLGVIGGRVKGAKGGTRGVVPPKYRNPDNPAETWAGRGLKPRWLQAALKAGGKLEDFAIGASGKRLRGQPKKARAK